MKYILLLLLVSCGLYYNYDYVVYLPDGRWVCDTRSFKTETMLYDCTNEKTGEYANSINAVQTVIVELRR